MGWDDNKEQGICDDNWEMEQDYVIEEGRVMPHAQEQDLNTRWLGYLIRRAADEMQRLCAHGGHNSNQLPGRSSRSCTSDCEV